MYYYLNDGVYVLFEAERAYSWNFIKNALERVPIGRELAAKALKVLEEASLENNDEAFRYQVWLKEWNERRGKG